MTCTLGVLGVQADVATNPQVIIFEKQWRTGKVPKDWKRAHMPIFEIGRGETQNDPSN